MLELVVPAIDHLPEYIAALERGWSPDTMRAETAKDELDAIQKDPARFVALMTDMEGRGDPITLPDNSVVSRLPGFRLWLWDGEFCGNFGFRWQVGTTALPPYCLGHISYAVVPWKQCLGYAKRGLNMFLENIRGMHLGLPYVELTTNTFNTPSQKVIAANNGILIERFKKTAAHGGAESFRYRINL